MVQSPPSTVPTESISLSHTIVPHKNAKVTAKVLEYSLNLIFIASL